MSFYQPPPPIPSVVYVPVPPGWEPAPLWKRALTALAILAVCGIINVAVFLAFAV